MTQKQATKLLQTKYPEAKIYRNNEKFGYNYKGSYSVMFSPNGKVYTYKSCRSYEAVLATLGVIEEPQPVKVECHSKLLDKLNGRSK